LPTRTYQQSQVLSTDPTTRFVVHWTIDVDALHMALVCKAANWCGIGTKTTFFAFTNLHRLGYFFCDDTKRWCNWQYRLSNNSFVFSINFRTMTLKFTTFTLPITTGPVQMVKTVFRALRAPIPVPRLSTVPKILTIISVVEKTATP
jgi:hypothetical protein